MIMSSTCRNLLFDTLHVCCWINCIIWKFLSGIGSGDRGHVLSNCSQIITISSLPREIKLHGQSSRAKNLQQIHQFAILLPSFLLTLNFPKKNTSQILKKYIQKFSYRTRNSYLLYGEMLETKFILRSKFKDNFGGK